MRPLPEEERVQTEDGRVRRKAVFMVDDDPDDDDEDVDDEDEDDDDEDDDDDDEDEEDNDDEENHYGDALLQSGRLNSHKKVSF